MCNLNRKRKRYRLLVEEGILWWWKEGIYTNGKARKVYLIINSCFIYTYKMLEKFIQKKKIYFTHKQTLLLRLLLHYIVITI